MSGFFFRRFKRIG